MLKKWVVVFMLCLFTMGCKESFDYKLIAEGIVTQIKITGGGFANPSKRIFYLDDGSLTMFYSHDYQAVKIGDYIYIYHRNWDGKIITYKLLGDN